MLEQAQAFIKFDGVGVLFVLDTLNEDAFPDMIANVQSPAADRIAWNFEIFSFPLVVRNARSGPPTMHMGKSGLRS